MMPSRVVPPGTAQPLPRMPTALTTTIFLLLAFGWAGGQVPDVVVTGGPTVVAGQTARLVVTGASVDGDLGVLVEIGGVLLPESSISVRTTGVLGEVVLYIDVPSGTTGSSMVVTVTGPGGSTSTTFTIL